MLFEHFFALSISLEFLPTDRSFVTKITKMLYFTASLSTSRLSDFLWNRFWLPIRDAGPWTQPSRKHYILHTFVTTFWISGPLSKYFSISFKILPTDGTFLTKIMKMINDFWAKVAPRAGEPLENTT